MVADLPTKLEPINFLKEKTFHCLQLACGFSKVKSHFWPTVKWTKTRRHKEDKKVVELMIFCTSD